ncbi:MAG: VWA domain-containing protein, partial [Euryarchaeota archaeon]|nr:VWA domain-containing protein [Euryarchaeota archaeon]
EYFNNIPALSGPVIDFSLDESFETAQISIPYDYENIENPSDLSIFYFNESLGTFVRIESAVDPVSHTVTGTTSHFSTFAIFSVPNWNALFEADMNLGRGGTDVVYVDVMFTMDSSGSMRTNDRYGYRKTAAKSFVGALISGDRAGVVDFDHYARVTRPLTDNLNAVNSSINSLDSSGGTNIGTGVGTANNHLISSGDSGHAWMMILLTDGQGYYNNYYTQQAVNNNITIYTIGLGSGVNSGLLTGIATATGGQYYSVSTADQLPQVFRAISSEIEPTDTDGDGIPDITETDGFRDGLGHWYYTDPNDPDTDGDGLSDGEEAGVLVEVNGRTYFNIISDPILVDGDHDGIDDPDELILETNPLNSDSDYDDIIDGIDPYPLTPVGVEPEPGVLEIGRDIMLGAVFGETGIIGGSMNWMVGDSIASSSYYLVGWLSFSLVPVAGAVADARDAVQAFINGDELGAALNAAGVFSGLGDAVKVSGAVGTFVVKYPGKISDVGKVLAKYVLKYVPSDLVKIKTLDKLSDNVASTLIKGDIGADELLKVIENNGDLGKTLDLVKSGDEVRWLEEGLTVAEAKALGKKPAGWKHIFEKHIKDYNDVDKNQFADAFDRTGSNYRSEESIQNIIYDCIREGTKDKENYYYKVTSEHAVRTSVGSNGYIETSHPMKIKKVPIPL